jgi:hypothetical protein
LAIKDMLVGRDGSTATSGLVFLLGLGLSVAIDERFLLIF